MTDGPFAETIEILGGFIYIDARDRDKALRIGGRIPIARLGSIEVRAMKPIVVLSPRNVSRFDFTPLGILQDMNTNDFETGMYYDRASAENMVRELHDLGYSDKDISVLMHDKDKAKAFATDTGSHAAEGAVTGGAIGGGLGAILAGLLATGSIAAVVGTGGIAAPLVAGPLAAALAGLGAGAATGGIVGALVGAGIPKERAAKYEEGLKRGGILLGVTPRAEHRERVRDLFTTNRDM